MKEIKTDIVIVGGGLTGLLSACALSSLELKILLIDAGVIFSDLNKKDFRTTAIAEGSKLFFEELGIWKNIYKHSEKIKSIKVFDRNISRKITFLMMIAVEERSGSDLGPKKAPKGSPNRAKINAKKRCKILIALGAFPPGSWGGPADCATASVAVRRLNLVDKSQSVDWILTKTRRPSTDLFAKCRRNFV